MGYKRISSLLFFCFINLVLLIAKTPISNGDWAIDIVGSSGYGRAYSSLAVDSSGNVHMSYYDNTNRNLKYTTNKTGKWETETVDSDSGNYDSEDVGQYSSLAVDSSGNVHISYYYSSSNTDGTSKSSLKYATKNLSTGKWKTEEVDSAETSDPDEYIFVGTYTSLVVDPSGNVHISYYYSISFFDSSSSLKYATNKSGSWKTEKVESGNTGEYEHDDVGKYNSLTIDSSGSAHISYHYSFYNGYSSKSSLKYATNQTGSWQTEEVEMVESDYGEYYSVGTDTSIAVDSSGKVHISYHYSTYYSFGGYGFGSLKYATGKFGVWQSYEVDRGSENYENPEFIGQNSSLAVGASGKVHISYCSNFMYSDYGSLKYAIGNFGSWNTEVVDGIDATIIDSSDTTSLAVESSGHVHISYHVQGGYLRHALKKALPNVTTGSATEVTATSATLNGTVNANGSETTVWFGYGTTSGIHPFDDTTSPINMSGTSDTPVSIPISGLTPDTVYYYRLVGKSEAGEVLGEERSFVTKKSLPTVITEIATDITNKSATLTGKVNANGLETTAWFEYGTTSGLYSNKSSTKGVSGSSDTPVSIPISGLTPDTVYYYRLVGQSIAGKKEGSQESFTTLKETPQPLPNVKTGIATDIKVDSATLNGMVNANGLLTNCWFEYGTTSGSYPNTTITKGVSGSSDTPVSIPISGLTPDTVYYYRLVGQSIAGKKEGSQESFATLKETPQPLPNVTTGIATDVKVDSATLNGTVNANDLVTNCWFEYGTTSGSYTKTTTKKSVSGSSDTPISIPISDLTPETVYYYRLVAQSIAGKEEGSELQFNTLEPNPPIVNTESAENVTLSLATLQGTVNAKGAETTAWFEYGTTSESYTDITDKKSVSGSIDTPVSIVVNGLYYDTTYYYRIVAENSGGRANGQKKDFKTTKPVSLTLTASEDEIELNKDDEEEIIITLTGSDENSDTNINKSGVNMSSKDTIPIFGKTVKPRVKKKHRKLITVSPKSVETDSNGEAKFTITAEGNTGTGNVIFKSGTKKTKVEVIAK